MQRVTKGLSVIVFFILMSFAGLFAVIHGVYDQPIIDEAALALEKAEAVKIYEDTSKGERKIDATGNIIVEDGSSTTGEGSSQGGSLAGHGITQFTETPGTIVLYIILGLALLAGFYIYLLNHRSPSIISFVVIVVIMIAGLIFDPDDKKENLLTELPFLTTNKAVLKSLSPQDLNLKK